MSVQIENRFLREPSGYTDEEGEFAYVDATAATDTADKAREWLIQHASDVLYIHPGEARVRPDQIELRALGVSMQWPGLLPERWDIERLVRDGLCDAWWRFDVSLAREPEPGWEARADEILRQHDAEQKRRAVAWRGPWWWRLRCRVADVLLTVASRVQPDDRSTVSWRDGAQITIEEVRRPA